MDDLERAIFCELDPQASEELKKSARNYLEKLKQNQDIWKFCFTRLFQANKPEVQFWCLQTLAISFKEPEFYQKTTELQQKEIQKALMTYFVNSLCKQENSNFIKNKFCEVLVYFFKFQYSEKMWPLFFKDLFSTLNSGAIYVEMFLRILNTIDELIVTSDMGGPSKKERMRNNAVVWFYFYF
jgi:hypothetical protein